MVVVDWRVAGRVHLGAGLNGGQRRRMSLGSLVGLVGHAYERIRLAENGGLDVELDPDGVFGIWKGGPLSPNIELAPE